MARFTRSTVERWLKQFDNGELDERKFLKLINQPGVHEDDMVYAHDYLIDMGEDEVADQLGSPTEISNVRVLALTGTIRGNERARAVGRAIRG